MRTGRATALLLWLAASLVLVLFLAEASGRLDAREAATERAERAGDAVVQALEQEARALRSVAGLIATDPGFEGVSPRAALEARWPHLTVDLLALERDGAVTALSVVEGAEPAPGLGAGPQVVRQDGRVWLIVGERRPASSDRVLVGRRLDEAFVQALSARLGVDLALVLDGALAAEAGSRTEAGGALLGAEGGLLQTSTGQLAVASVDGGQGTRWIVGAPVLDAGRGAAIPLAVLCALLVGTVIFVGLGERRLPPREVRATPAPAPRDPRLARQAQQLAEERRKVELYSRYLARLALELRTSVTAVIGYAELLKEDAQREQRWTEASDVDRILVGARTGLDLVEDTLALTRMESGQLEVQVDVFQLGTVLHDVVGALRPIGASLGTRIELESDGVGSVYTDRARLRHVFRNLVARGLHAAPGGRVSVAARCEGSSDAPWVRVDVMDDGPSLTPGQLDGLFAASPFEASDAVGPGSTIGLVVARRFAVLLGGDLSADTRRGGGTCLTLRVPARLEPEAVDAARRASPRRSHRVER